MTSNRVGGPSSGEPGKGPDTRMQEQHRKIEKVEKVRAVDETENEHTRKKFQRFMDEEPEERERSPSPLESEFYKAAGDVGKSLLGGTDSASSALEDLGEHVVASPSYSPPPNCSVTPEPEENEKPPLPQSHKFWAGVDSPPDQKIRDPKFRETSESSKKKESAKKKEKESLYGPPGKTEKTAKSGVEKTATATSPHKKKPSEPIAQPKSTPLRSKEEESKPTDSKKKAKEEIFLDNRKTSPEQKFESDKERKEKKFVPIEIESPSEHLLPASVTPMAQTAATQAAPYLNAQTTLLFFQMVGTIYVMTTTSGVSRTEILLNSPAFAGSKFFGATISIEKYATAPDSLNIRLTGTDEAVKTFNQNISNLYAAFQNGNFKFRIGRINAEYSIERPLFRRKDPKERSEGGDLTDQRGKQ